MRVGSIVVAAVAVALATAPPARADDRVRACVDASTAGQTLRQQGHLLGARERMIACSRDACPAVVRAHCVRWLGEIDDRIPSIVVRVQDGAGQDLVDARVVIDGKAARLDGRAVSLDPGEHVVAVESGGRHEEERIILVEGEASRLVMLRIGSSAPSGSREASSSPPATTRVPLGAWVVGGMGLAALGVATYLGVAASSQLQDLKSGCSPNCTDAQTRPGRTDALVFDTLLGVGGAAVGVALVWALAFPSSTTVEIQPVMHGGLASFGMRY